MKHPLKTNIYLKIGIIFIIGLLLLIPTEMIESLIHERESTQQNAVREVSSKWGEEQTLQGPFISIPYNKYGQQNTANDKLSKTVQYTDYVHILPSELTISGYMNPERRYRGIYEIVVYNSKLEISGTFKNLNLSNSGIPIKDMQLDNAVFTIGVNDLRGIEKQIQLNWNSTSHSFNPGVVGTDVVKSGINATIALAPNDSSSYTFSFTIDLNGSQLLYFTPVGKVTNITMNSSWNNPSFNGAFLPDSRSITDSGFTANWNVLHLNRNYPQVWSGNKYSIGESAFGIDLLLPVDNYQKSYRSIRYAILFIGFTFIAFFFIEILNSIFIHPIQYILVGIALVVFYTLLLSISEQLTYNLAFVISALATLILITGYVKAIIKSTSLVLLIIAILLILYTFIFVIIQLQDFALLIGSIGIFMIVSCVMYFSRKIDWYAINLGEKKELQPKNIQEHTVRSTDTATEIIENKNTEHNRDTSLPNAADSGNSVHE